MILSGSVAAALLSCGLVFKFGHWPGAGILVVTGLLSASLIFLPLLFILKIKEKQEKRDKLLLLLGSVPSVLIGLHVMFKIMHWPFAGVIGIAAMLILMLLFLPLYFLSGIRREETKVNTIVSSILLTLGCGLVFSLVRAPKSTETQQRNQTVTHYLAQQLLNIEFNDAKKLTDSTTSVSSTNEIYRLCEAIKADILREEIGAPIIVGDFEKNKLFISESYIKDISDEGNGLLERLHLLNEKIERYGRERGQKKETPGCLPQLVYATKQLPNEKVPLVLNTLVQLQMFMLQQEKAL
jgi:hypothetical protein